jgi:hypothetical protein
MIRHELKKEHCWGVDCAAPFHVGLRHSLSQQDKLHGYPGSHRNLIEFDAHRIPMVFGLHFYVPIFEVH